MVVAYPLNNTEYTAEDAMIYNCTRTSGVFASSEHFDIEISGNREITIGTGLAWMNYAKLKGLAAAVKEPEALSIDLASASQSRIDTVVLGYSASENAVRLYIKKGSASGTPQRPALSKSDSLYELGLYDILVPAASTAVLEGHITDTREESARCGMMGSGLTDLDKLATMEYVDQTMGDISAALADITAALNAL